jgi:hypothetical protein
MDIPTTKPSAMTQSECMDELRRFKESTAIGWRKRREQLVRRIGELTAPTNERLDPLDMRIKLVTEAMHEAGDKSWKEPDDYGNRQSFPGFKVQQGTLGGLTSVQLHNGEAMNREPSVQFVYPETEAENEASKLLIELMDDLLAFMGQRGEDEKSVHRAFHLLKFYRHPRSHEDLALTLGVRRSTATDLVIEMNQRIKGITSRRGTGKNPVKQQ